MGVSILSGSQVIWFSQELYVSQKVRMRKIGYRVSYQSVMSRAALVRIVISSISNFILAQATFSVLGNNQGLRSESFVFADGVHIVLDFCLSILCYRSTPLQPLKHLVKGTYHYKFQTDPQVRLVQD
jgi:hypothetical protein